MTNRQSLPYVQYIHLEPPELCVWELYASLSLHWVWKPPGKEPVVGTTVYSGLFHKMAELRDYFCWKASLPVVRKVYDD